MHTGSQAMEEGETNNHHVIDIWKPNKDRLESMLRKTTESPKLLSRAAGDRSCCIFRVPKSLVDINGRSYQPHIVSIGPYHHTGHPQLKMIQEHKWSYLGSMLSRTQAKLGLGLEDYLKAIAPFESKARECYSETIQLSSDEFLEMMVLDGCFVLELFRRVGRLVQSESDDPIFTMSWILPFFYRDFLRMENQIPFFILESLFDKSKLPEDDPSRTLSILALEFFNYVMQRPDEVISKHENLKGRHLLDLVRASIIPPEDETGLTKPVSTPTHLIHCISKLRRAGIKLNQGKYESFLVIKFRGGVIEMPTITFDDFMSSFLLNCVAYEQCYIGCSKHITTYVTLLDCLINTYRDVEYLCDRNIMENHLGTDGEIAQLINNMGKDVAFDMDMCYLSQLFNDVHQHYSSSWHVQWASFKYTYFDTPWSFISALAALILLLLTVAQTFFTVYPFIGHNGSQ